MQIRFSALGSIDSELTAEELQNGLINGTIDIHIRGGYAEFCQNQGGGNSAIVARACLGYSDFSVTDA